MKLEWSKLCMLIVDIMREIINKDAEGANYLKKKCGQLTLPDSKLIAINKQMTLKPKNQNHKTKLTAKQW